MALWDSEGEHKPEVVETGGEVMDSPIMTPKRNAQQASPT
jgi:hypothetical protein